MSVQDGSGAPVTLRARLTEVAGRVAQDEALARRLHELATTAAAGGTRDDFAALYAELAFTTDDMARLLPENDEGRLDGTTTTTTITTTTTVTTGACTTTTLTTTTTTTQLEVEPDVELG